MLSTSYQGAPLTRYNAKLPFELRTTTAAKSRAPVIQHASNAAARTNGWFGDAAQQLGT